CHAHARRPVPTQLSRVPGWLWAPVSALECGSWIKEGGSPNRSAPGDPPSSTNQQDNGVQEQQGRRRAEAGAQSGWSRGIEVRAHEGGQGTLGIGGEVERGRIECEVQEVGVGMELGLRTAAR